MKKIITTTVIASALVLAGSANSFAATKATPIAKPSKAAEGTAAHEKSESASTQKSESTMKTKSKSSKKSTK